tara:strand:- start:11073 stop:11837 length:765 start_codon:yes stop_codon:yes gene_type:complete
MKTNKIFFNGCSYTVGIGASEALPDMYDLRYSKLLCDRLGAEEDNIAVQGSCNNRIARSTFNHLLDPANRCDLAIVMWSDPSRTEIDHGSSDKDPLSQITPQGIDKFKRGSSGIEEALEFYYGFLVSPGRQIHQTLQDMISVEVLCKYLEIPIIHMHYKENTNRLCRHALLDTERMRSAKRAELMRNYIHSTVDKLEKNPHCFGFSKNLSFNTLIRERGFKGSLYCGGHPSAESYKMMADWFYDYITKEELFTN